MAQKSWNLLSKKSPTSADEILKILLQNRGLNSKKETKEFLEPDLNSLLNLKLSDIEKTIKRIKKAIENGEEIIVYSDYDADGICGTAILWETLNIFGAKVLPYVPHRQKEGYGFSKAALKDLAKKGAKLIITVDHGITAEEEVDFAAKLDIDVIITDHHLPPKKLPKAFAIVHTTRLCGTGVAFILAKNLWKSFGKSEDQILEKLDLVAIATIADMVPLLDLNRIAVKFGLPYLQRTKRPGLLALMNEAGIKPQNVGTYEISRILSPRINASGRLEHAIEPLRLLCTRNTDRAKELAKLIGKTNSKRQKMTEEAIVLAKSIFEEESLLPILVHEEFHEGIIGLVAQKMAEEFYKPVVVIAKGENVSKGSARSVGEFNIVETLRSCSQFLIEVGGHPKAAGFQIKTEKIEIFSQKLRKFAEKTLGDGKLSKIVNIDIPIDSSLINRALFEKIQDLAPFGMGNPEPVFLTRNFLVENLRTVGSLNNHLKLQVRSDSKSFETIGFGLGEEAHFLRPGMEVDLVYTLSQDSWNGNTKLVLKVKDLRVNDKEPILSSYQ
ncbi:single-stranded-DNA-specific exonuclease RecJ [Candidatus Curtissbacteria bacterium RBG_16_39_7]|uniref:Single-stranded-DNA-specific exonuclease RecJ n=1 Tax=Candidatus Curtissbacteria bacterium RBG_16_39_7 TaxID=1797707 RepID=A0A1F5G1P5_9BACT|nr:MAG: single-stranded-DNA-specific exonuclease RecJ [Candidatus Curtissbacteria bacterium RBG_16_39_7]